MISCILCIMHYVPSHHSLDLSCAMMTFSCLYEHIKILEEGEGLEQIQSSLQPKCSLSWWFWAEEWPDVHWVSLTVGSRQTFKALSELVTKDLCQYHNFLLEQFIQHQDYYVKKKKKKGLLKQSCAKRSSCSGQSRQNMSVEVFYFSWNHGITEL